MRDALSWVRGLVGLIAVAIVGLGCLAGCASIFQEPSPVPVATIRFAEPTPVPVATAGSPEPTGTQIATVSPSPSAFRRGQIESVAGEHGNHVLYVPVDLGTAPPIVVLVHGTPAEHELAEDAARTYVEYWQAWADEHGAILIAPAFDQPNFGSKNPDMTGGGYRGLFGREIGADEWVLSLVGAVQAQVGGDGRFFLYGHSAGGQHVARFLMTHPERLRGAVITSALTYPHPNPGVPWPYGLGPLEATLQWTDPPAGTEVRVVPDPETWLAGLAVPTTVIVGLNDLERQLDWPGQPGKNNRVVIARFWVGEMTAFAAEHGAESRLDLSLVPGLGHSSYGLLRHSQLAMGEALGH